jgi:hypothetical protein
MMTMKETIFHMLSCTNSMKLTHKITFSVQTCFLVGVVLDSMSSSFRVNMVIVTPRMLLFKSVCSYCSYIFNFFS